MGVEGTAVGNGAPFAGRWEVAWRLWKNWMWFKMKEPLGECWGTGTAGEEIGR